MGFQAKAGVTFIQWDTLPSTNDWVKAHATTLKQEGVTCVSALAQSAGRGTYNRSWVSPPGVNVYASLFSALSHPPSCPLLGAQLLGATCQELLVEMGFAPEIRYPNDLLLGKRKCAGILCEVIGLPNGYGLVAGIGLNVNMTPEALALIDQPATSLLEVSQRLWSVDEIVYRLANRWATKLSHGLIDKI